MTSTRDHVIDATIRDMEAQVRSLENECRALKETLLDRFAMAALSGIAAHMTGPTVGHGQTAKQAHAQWAWEMAAEMMARRPRK